MSPFTQLPAELVDLVACHFRAEQFRHFRLTSRWLNQATWQQFKQRYLRTLNVSLERPRFNQFADLANSPELAAAVESLVMKVDSEVPARLAELKRSLDSTYSENETHAPRVAEFDLKLFEFHKAALELQHPFATVSDISVALRGCIRLKSVRIAFYESDGYVAPVYDRGYYLQYHATSFELLLNAIMESDLQLHSLTMDGSLDPCFTPLHVFRFSIPVLLRLNDRFRKLKILSLRIAAHFEGSGPLKIPGWENGISQFISTAQALEELSLYIYVGGQSVPIIRSIGESLFLPKLRSLLLKGCDADECSVSALLERHSQSIRSLTFADMGILDGTWKGLLRTIRDNMELDYWHIDMLWQGLSDDTDALAANRWFLLFPPLENPHRLTVDTSTRNAYTSMTDAFNLMIQHHRVEDVTGDW